MCGIPGERVHTSPHPSGDDCRSLPRPNNNNTSSTGRATTPLRAQFTTDVKQGTAVGDDVPHRILHLNSPHRTTHSGRPISKTVQNSATCGAPSGPLYLCHPYGHYGGSTPRGTPPTQSHIGVTGRGGIPWSTTPVALYLPQGEVYAGTGFLDQGIRSTNAELYHRDGDTRESGYFTPLG